MHYRAPNDPKPHWLDDDTNTYLLPPGSLPITDEEAQQMRDALAYSGFTQEQLVSMTRIKAKTLLLQILPLLTSMQVDAQETGETVNWQGQPTPLSTVIRQLKAGLGGVAEMDLSSYQTAEEMEEAIQTAYFALAVQAPAQVKSAFSALVPK